MRITEPRAVSGISRNQAVEASRTQAEGSQGTSSSETVSSRIQPVKQGGETQETETLDQRRENLKRAAETLNDTALMMERKLKFRVHDKTGEVFVQVTHADTGKVISTIPPESVLDMHARFHDGKSEFPPLVMDRKA